MSGFFSNSGNISDLFDFAGGVFGGLMSPTPDPPKFTSNMDNPYFYQPTWQGGADTMFQGLYSNWQNPIGPAQSYLSGGLPYASAGLPYTSATLPYASASLPYAAASLPGYGNVLGGLGQYYQSSQYNPYAFNQQTNAATLASPLSEQYSGLAGLAGTQGYNLGNYGLNAVDNLIQGLGNNNPYLDRMIQGAQAGGSALVDVGRGALTNAAGLTSLASGYAQPLTSYASSGLAGLSSLADSTTAGILPYARDIAGSMPGLASSYTAPSNAAAGSILNTAFDPQGALYARSFQQNLDQTRAGLAARGLNDSAVGAGIENQSNMDFNTNWQNQQLGRQIQGLGAYGSNAGTNYGMLSSAYGQGLNSLLSGASGTFSPYSTVYGQGLSGLNTAATTGYGLASGSAQDAYSLGSSGANSIISGSAAPYTQQNTANNNFYSQLADLSNTGGRFGNISAAASPQMSSAISSQMAATSLPYDTYQSILGNQYGGMTNYLAGLGGYGQGIGQYGQNVGQYGQNVGGYFGNINSYLGNINSYLGGQNYGQNWMNTVGNQMLSYLNQGTGAATNFAGAQNDAFYAAIKAAQQNQQGTGDLFSGLGNLVGDVLPFLGL